MTVTTIGCPAQRTSIRSLSITSAPACSAVDDVVGVGLVLATRRSESRRKSAATRASSTRVENGFVT